ncbi:MAG: hypothetical protein ACE5H4_11640 [Candidatus Thorarchaeota archaeon]
MYMIIALILLGVLSFATALYWRRKLDGFESLFSFFTTRFNPDEVDISGQQKYTRCLSHRWVMKNMIHGDYTNSETTLGDFVGQNTFAGTMIVGLVLGSLPVLAVYLLFQSFVLVGAALVAVFAAVFIVRSPEDVGASYNLLKYLTEQDQTELMKGDLAYARISSNQIKVWIRNLIIIGVASIIVAPWGELIPDAMAMAIAGFFNLFLVGVFIPLADFSFALALLLFIFGVPLVPIIAYAVVRSLRRRAKIRRDGFIVEA